MITVFSASTLTGYEIVNKDEVILGILKEIMIDVEMGKISYAVLEYKDEETKEEKLFAIPWESLTLNTAKKQFILDATIKQLKQAKGFDEPDRPAFANPRWLEAY